MASTHPKGRENFQKILNKRDGSTPQPRREAKNVEPITWVDPVLEGTHVEPQKKSKKRDIGSRRSHSSPRHHLHGVGSSSLPLSKSLFGASMQIFESININLNGPE